jgi:O-antigen ligase
MKQFDRLWVYAVCGWFVLMTFFGGVSTPSNWQLLLQSLSSMILLCFALWRLRTGFPTPAAAFGAVIASLTVGFVLIQNMPIPFSIWASLPGRQLFVDSFAAIGAKPTSLAFSLSPLQTSSAAIALIPALAGFFATLTLRIEDYGKLALTILTCALVGLMIGLAQKSLGEISGLYFYASGDAKVATGTFGNRNFFAAQLFLSIPFAAAFASALAQKQKTRPWLIAIFALVYVVLLVAGLAAVGSRAGLILAMVSVLLSVTYVFRMPAAKGMSQARWSVYALLICFVVVAQLGMVGVMRVLNTDPMEDYRGDIYTVALQAAKSYFPAGSGFGTFIPVYQQFETPAVILDRYVNHAHNEWLEQLLEGGAPALLLIAVFLAAYLVNVTRISRLATSVAHHAYYRAAAVVIFLMLCHATVDFALRTPALLSLFAVSCGFLVVSHARTASPIFRNPKVEKPPESKMRAFDRPKHGFGSPRA